MTKIDSKYFFLILLCTFMCILSIYIQENKIQDFSQNDFDNYILSRRELAQSFTFQNEHSPVPEKMLYHPFQQAIAFNNIPLDLLRASITYSKTCNEIDFIKADNIALSYVQSPSKLLLWHKSKCTNNPKLINHWITREPFIHPTGTSYAKLYSEAFKDHKLKNLSSFYHINEKINLGKFEIFFASLKKSEQAKFINDFQKIVINNYFIFQKIENSISRNLLIFPLNTINQELRHSYSLVITPKSESVKCKYLVDNICLQETNGSFYKWKKRWNKTCLLYICLLLLAWLTIYYLNKRKDSAQKNLDQALLFQLISHEIRTPMTSLKLNLDGLRGQFEAISEKAQQELMKSFNNFQELERIVVKALEEIKSDKDLRIFNIYNLTDTIIYNNYEQLVDYSYTESNAFIQMSPFWFEICIKNLINNAIHHGKAPIKLRVYHKGTYAYLEVQDEGEVSLRTLKASLKPLKKGAKSQGVGIGLSMVYRKIKEVGGELIIESNPTKFIIKFKTVEKQV